MRYGAEDWDAVVDLLAGADEVVIACHLNPDGDALGSLMGAALGLAKRGARVHATWAGSPVVMPPAYEFLPGADLLVEPARLPQASTWLALDCGAGDRLGDLEAPARASGRLVNVDHHSGNDLFGDLNVVVPEASSTAELVAYLLLDAGIQLDRDIATCLYTGVVTDTGRFQYANSSPDTLRLAADLLAYGVPATAIAQEVFESAPFGYLKLVGRMLERAVLCEKERFVYSWITLGDLDETGVLREDTDNLIDVVRATGAAEVAALFKEQEDGTYRVSLRSKGPTSVGAIARSRGGGGHELAAGFTAADVESGVAGILESIGA